MSTEAPKALTKNEELLAACKANNVSAVKALLSGGEARADFERYDPGVWGASHRESPIHLALMARPYSIEIITLLLEAGAKVNAAYEDYNWKGGGSKQTAFQMAADIALRNKDGELLRLFLKHGGDPNMPTVREAHTMRYDGSESHTPIHTAVRAANIECLRALLNAGANVDAKATNRGQSEYGQGSNDRHTALHMACKGNSEETLIILLEAGANVNAVSQRLDNVHREVNSPTTDPRSGGYISSVECILVKETSIHIAVMENKPKFVRILVAARADLSIPRIYGETQQTVMELCKTDEMKQALKLEWTPENHRIYSTSVRKEIRMTLLCARRQNWPLPKEMLFYLFKFIAASISQPTTKTTKPEPEDNDYY